MYLLATRPTSTTFLRSWRLRLPVLWLFKCFLPAWLRTSLPLAVTRKRFLEALCVFILGMAVPQLHQPRTGVRGWWESNRPLLRLCIVEKIGGACRGENRFEQPSRFRSEHGNHAPALHPGRLFHLGH